MLKKISIKQIILFSLLFHILAAFFSEGFHRPDEHLGIFRFMGYKLGTLPGDILSWEYPARIRPWAHPYLFVGLAKVSNFFGVTSPFTLATVLRFFCSLLGFLSILLLFKDTKKFLEESWHKLYALLLFGLWYLPFFHARTTAENLGITIFIFGLSFYLKKLNTLSPTKDGFQILHSHALLAGLLMGASFIFRFQMGIMVFTTMVWFLFFAKLRLINFIITSLGIALFIALNTIFDYWGYGEWTFSAWNYVDQNLIKGVAAGFGRSPWYEYITKSFSRAIPPFSLFLIIPTLYFWIKKPTHLITWIMGPFFLVHTYIAHKELRFIFPLGIFIPLLSLILIIEKKDFFKGLYQKKFTQIIIGICVIESLGGLFISSLRPAYAPIKFYKHLYHKNEKIEAVTQLSVFRDQLKFYLKNPITEIVQEDRSIIKSEIQNLETTKWYQMNKFHDIKMFDEFKNCKRDYLSYPEWVFNFNFGNWMKRSKIWALYKCGP